MILFCGCKTNSVGSTAGAEYQDRQFGKGMRGHNYSPKGYGGSPGWRCTVCRNVKRAEPKV